MYCPAIAHLWATAAQGTGRREGGPVRPTHPRVFEGVLVEMCCTGCVGTGVLASAVAVAAPENLPVC